MRSVLLTFLGPGRYETITYTWQDKSYTTHLLPEAAWRSHTPCMEKLEDCSMTRRRQAKYLSLITQQNKKRAGELTQCES